jgi:5-methylcytosine-specific restriction enzyme subunit McrC
MDSLTLRESSPPIRVPLPEAVAASLQQLNVATVSPAGQGEWWISGVTKVGALRIHDLQVRIEPKVAIARLFHLLARSSGWDAWRDDDVQLASIDDLYPAIAGLFARMSVSALGRGVLRAYRTERRSEPFIRGRWLATEQIRLRQGLPLPAELSIDEYTDDIDENRLLKSAARRALRSPDLSSDARRRLHLVDHQLADVSVLTRGVPLPTIHTHRLNARFAPALTLAKLIMEDASLDHDVADVSASGFLLTMSTVFERFVEAEVIESAHQLGGRVVPQHRSYLDRDGLVEVKPDLVWLDAGKVVAVFDAKYKSEKPAGFPNADIYQMLAYCVHHAVPSGHLVYAAGNERPARYVIESAGVTVVCHALDLDAPPSSIRRHVNSIVDEAATGTRFGARRVSVA